MVDWVKAPGVVRAKYLCASAANPLPDVYSDLFGHILGGCHPYESSAFIMKHPLRIRVFFLLRFTLECGRGMGMLLYYHVSGIV